MELQKLKYFYTVAKTGHVTRAAESICIAQPALTQAIKSLESELGVPLFAKKGRNIVLTQYGEYLQKRLESILPEFDGLTLEMNSLKQRVRRTVRLNVFAASSLVVKTIVNFRKKYPDAVFDFEQHEEKYDCDVIITTNGMRGEILRGYKKQSVKEEKIYLAVPKTSCYATRGEIRLEEVREEEFVMFTSSRLFGVICNRFCRDSGLEPKILFESDSPATVQDMIGTGMGIAFWPEYSWGKLNNKNVVLIPIAEPECKRELIIGVREESSSIYAEEFYKELVRRI